MPMAGTEEARAYLERVLSEAGVEMSSASRALGLNHAYLQQYIRTGKPRYLKDHVREGLAKLLPNLDPERLRPDPIKLYFSQAAQRRAEREHQAQINPPRFGQFVDDPSTLEIIEIWGRITDPRQRRLARSILEQMTDRTSSSLG